MNKTYSISEVSDKLSLHPKTLRRWEEAGRFTPSRTLGNQRRYSVEDLQILDAIKHGLLETQSDLLTLPQAAALCGVTPITVERWVKEGKFHPFITAGKTYYPKPRLLEKLNELKPAPIHETATPQQPLDRYDLPPLPQQPSRPQAPQALTTPTPPRPKPVPKQNKPKPSSSLESSSPPISPLILTLSNLAFTLIAILTYHFIFVSPSKLDTQTPLTNNPTNQVGTVQGSATTRDPSLTLLDSILDKQGNLLTHGTLSSASLNLLPTTTADPTPGTLYFDSGSQSLKVFINGWHTLTLDSDLESALTSLSATSSANLASPSATPTPDFLR